MKMLFQVHFDWLAEVCHTFLMTVQLIDKMEKTEGKWEREVFGLVLLVTWNCVEMSIGISSSIAQTSPIQAPLSTLHLPLLPYIVVTIDSGMSSTATMGIAVVLAAS